MHITSQVIDIWNSHFSFFKWNSMGGILINFVRDATIRIDRCAFGALSAIKSEYDPGSLFQISTRDNLASYQRIYIVVNNTSFDKIYSLGKGGVFNVQKQEQELTMVVENCLFNNTFGLSGGILFALSKMSLHFLHNQICQQESIAKTHFLSFQFSKKTIWYIQQFGQGLFYLENSNVYFTDNAFHHIYYGGIGSFKQCRFTDQNSRYQDMLVFFGPALDFQYSLVNMRSLVLSDNSYCGAPCESEFQALTDYLNLKGLVQIHLKSVARIENCTITGNQMVKASIIRSDNSSLQILRSNFTSNRALNGSAVAMCNNNQPFHCNIQLNSISQSIFRNNQALSHGAIYLQQKCVEINSTQFIDNQAGDSGGAIYSTVTAEQGVSTQNYTFVVLRDNQFTNNSARFGGAIRSLGQEIDASKCAMSGNQAWLYGNDYFSYPKRVKFLWKNQNYTWSNPNDPIQIHNVTPGSQRQQLFIFLLDSDGSVIPYNQPLEMQINVTKLPGDTPDQQALQYTKSVARPYDECLKGYRFGDLVLRGCPNQVLRIDLASNSIRLPVLDQNQSFSHYLADFRFVIDFHLVACESGYLFIPTSEICQMCPEGTYSMESMPPTCTPCQNDRFSCNGGSSLTLHPHFWRSNTTSDEVLYCNNRPENCVGGSAS